jgi:ubiquitin-associated SH3 domain-containing protein
MPDSFIVYACPVGELADQLETYFSQSQAKYGANAAHQYMPHCTLTGFFNDEQAAIPIYLNALDRTLAQAPCPQPVITISKITFHPTWHGLELESNWLKQQIRTVAALADSPTRQEPLRLKDWLHLSLAYEFPPSQHQPLEQLARTLINPAAAVTWELRVYQRHPDYTWTCHQTWPLTPT